MDNELFANVTGEIACTTPWVLRGLDVYLMKDVVVPEGELLLAHGYMADMGGCADVGIMRHTHFLAQFLHRYGNGRALRGSGARMLFAERDPFC